MHRQALAREDLCASRRRCPESSRPAMTERSSTIADASIRPARAGDADGVRACVHAAFEHYVVRIGKLPAPMLADYPSLIAAGRVWIAERQAETIGALVQYETDGGFYIETVAVHPRHHGTGAGRALLRFAEREAVRRGFASVHLCTNSKMTENQVLYPKIGYVEYDRRTEAGYDRVFYRKTLG